MIAFKIIFGLLVVITSCASCSTVSYYHQSISGHFSLISKREPIDDIVNDSTRDEKLIEQLIVAKELRYFASTELKLPDNKSYLSYVQLDKPYVTWNVFAAPEFSIAGKHSTARRAALPAKALPISGGSARQFHR